MEHFKSIDFGEGRFAVSNLGRVKNNLTGKFYSTQIQNSGYEMVHLYFGGKRKAFTVHRLVAIAFLPEVAGKELVDHIDSNKLNNRASNLRWVTGKENAMYAVQNGLLDASAIKAGSRMKNIGLEHGFSNSQKNLIQAKPVTLKLNGDNKIFRSLRSAASFLNIGHKTLSARLKRGFYQ